MTATVEFLLGGESVTVPLDIDLPTETIITGDFGGVIPAGTTARLRGAVNFTADMHLRGTLVCDPTGVDLNGNGFDIHTHDGTLNLVGIEKSGWVRWGEPVVGWEVGDRLAVAPMKAAVYLPTEMVWSGGWATMTRPANSPDQTLIDGTIVKPEVANLSQTVVLRNLKRIMIHEASAPNPQTLKWVKILDSGEVGVLTHYPIHFHMIYDHARGSWLEGVVVEGGKNHSFVPHASHGITFKDCVAYNGFDEAFWWDPPVNDELINLSEDILYDHCLVMKLSASTAGDPFNTHAFSLTAGINNSCIDCVATCNQGIKSSGGFDWPSRANQTPNVWIMTDCVAHNNKANGIRVWQNDGNPHVIERFTSYRNGRAGIDHGAYQNRYRYTDITDSLGVTGGTNDPYGFALHANPGSQGPIEIENMRSDRPLQIALHALGAGNHHYFRNCQFPSVLYTEYGPNNPTAGFPSYIEYHDCDLTPADFTLTRIKADSVIELFEGAVLVDRWSSGGWE